MRSLTPDECLVPGYYRDPDWTVRDVVAHVGTWLAEAEVQFERISAGTYEGHDVDVDALNAALLEAMQGQPWEIAWVQANAGGRGCSRNGGRCASRPKSLHGGSARSASDHFGEHLGRLREWVAELTARRTRRVGRRSQPTSGQADAGFSTNHSANSVARPVSSNRMTKMLSYSVRTDDRSSP